MIKRSLAKRITINMVILLSSLGMAGVAGLFYFTVFFLIISATEVVFDLLFPEKVV